MSYRVGSQYAAELSGLSSIFSGKMDEIPQYHYKMLELPKEMENLPNRISANLEGKTVLMSGGSGFLGKVLLEKILRKTPAVEKIFLLLRSKRGKDPNQRIEDIFKSPLFENLRKTNPAVIKKVVAIGGDVSEGGGMCIGQEDRALLGDTVEVVFHAAATIRFDEPLRKAILLNTRGTKQMLELAKEMKKLQLFCHISTAYCHLQEKVLEEKAYPPATNPNNIIKCCELLDEDVIEEIGRKIMKGFPNSYSFTKNLSEGLVNQEIEKGLPALILRPSIVIPTWQEPLPGWTDNINGPTGLLIGAGKGVIRTMYCDNTGYADYLPVDICVNGILIAAWNFMQKIKDRGNIYNLTSNAEMKVTWQEILDVGRRIVEKEVPLNGCVWYPGGSMKRNRTLHNICFFLFHLIPAYFLDAIIFLSGNKPVLVRIQDRISKGFEVFEYYANNQWDFKNDNIVSLREKLNPRETLEYKINGDGMDIEKYFSDCILSTRKFILNEPPETIPKARRHMRMMYWVDKLTKTLFFALLLWFFQAWTTSIFNFFVSIYHLIEHILTFFTTESAVKPIRHDL